VKEKSIFYFFAMEMAFLSVFWQTEDLGPLGDKME